MLSARALLQASAIVATLSIAYLLITGKATARDIVGYLTPWPE